MDNLYRLEACSVCKVVSFVMPGIISDQRARDGTDKPTYISGVPIWTVDFCQSCRDQYEMAFPPAGKEGT